MGFFFQKIGWFRSWIVALDLGSMQAEKKICWMHVKELAVSDEAGTASLSQKHKPKLAVAGELVVSC
jgi:hypothetical protein